MVLVDTSVLIKFFKGLRNEKVIRFEEIIEKDIPYGINNFIYQELIQGARTEKEFNLLNDYLKSQRFYELKNGTKSFEMAARLYMKCRKSGITVRSTIDLLIVQIAIENDLYLLHDDNDFTNISTVEKKLKVY
ncbi:type II toxin-antitoxin system VapC family toxin [Mahella australiensis]|uniref:PilT protein domain protein n=1 Tax=Mahella australiensis (strain DSM 15567 / CIP 107919 / 50-1 BON) TaxID=697281 RepID=F4A078_MAHA5|nr:PIN domain nuclease [Mahella australiensis]AEE96912.1 PilT protein domain protein [Mahella australiensis 50-1 BON]